ncbi:MAG TPA: hypothetical protein VK034_32390 [Enhygromyxa sp.]|nr:hypothetical protein [Enhygromyxa sp.]
MSSRPRPLTRLTASVAAAALSFGLIAAAPAIALAGDKTTFLGLEGEGDPVDALSDALRWDLNQRGRDDGNTMSLAELKLTMGCGDDDLACLAQGGQAIGSQEFVFGTMTKSGAGWTVELHSLDVATGNLNNKIQRQISADDLGEAALGKTAASLIDELYKLDSATTTTTTGGGETSDDPGAGDPPTSDDPGQVDQPRSSGGLIWGPYSPRPAWKYAGLGVSAGLTVAAIGTAIGTTLAIGPNGSIRKDLLAAAENSLNDGKPSNDIDPNTSQDLCELAQAPPDPSKPDEVTNAEVTRVCIKADNLAKAATISWVATGVFAASTVVFTTLLFVHKDKRAAAKLLEHDVGLGGAPLPEGGFVLGGSMRF